MHAYCTPPAPLNDSDVEGERLRAFRTVGTAWPQNHTITYYIADYVDSDQVHRGFIEWDEYVPGLEFRRVDRRENADIRVGFDHNSGSWSYIGRQNLSVSRHLDTMNFGWPLRSDPRTILHEIGHALGLQHEHQNPSSPLVWDTQNVLDCLTGPPNYWTADMVRRNIFDRIEGDGTETDLDSIMMYYFKKGLIHEPVKYRTQALVPPNRISPKDKIKMAQWYPAVESVGVDSGLRNGLLLDLGEKVVESVLDFDVSGSYTFTTIGNCDCYLVLYEWRDNIWRWIDYDNDSGFQRNSLFTEDLDEGKSYKVVSRLLWKPEGDFTAGLIYWKN